jgi:hypothetical protein
VRHALGHAIAVLFRETAGDDDLHTRVGRLDRLPMVEPPVGLLLRVVAHGAGVEHQHRRVVGALGERVAGGGRAAHDVLRVGFVHLAAVRLDVDRRHYFVSFVAIIASSSIGR